MREIHIRPALNGFIVTVGCSVVVFNSLPVMCKELEHYFLDPKRVESEYQRNAINKQSYPEPPASDCRTGQLGSGPIYVEGAERSVNEVPIGSPRR